jgi:hypothetical protein
MYKWIKRHCSTLDNYIKIDNKSFKIYLFIILYVKKTDKEKSG